MLLKWSLPPNIFNTNEIKAQTMEWPRFDACLKPVYTTVAMTERDQDHLVKPT